MANTRRYLASGVTRFELIPYDELDLSGSVTGGDIVDATITSGKLAADAVTDSNVDSIGVDKLSGGTNGQVLSRAGGEAVWADISDIPPTPATARFAGEVSWHAGATAPDGWLVADGSSYLRATYAELFTAIGTLHGAADGTHFNVPNLVGASPKGSAADGSTVGATGGADTVTIATGNLPAHAHTVGTLATSADSAGTPAGSVSIATASAGTPAGSLSMNAMGPHNHFTTELAIPFVNRGPTYGASIGKGIYSASPDELMYWFNGSGITTTSNSPGTPTGSFVGSALAAHGHSGSTFTGSALGTHTHTITGSTANAGSGTALNVEAKHVKLLPVIKT